MTSLRTEKTKIFNKKFHKNFSRLRMSSSEGFSILEERSNGRNRFRKVEQRERKRKGKSKQKKSKVKVRPKDQKNLQWDVLHLDPILCRTWSSKNIMQRWFYALWLAVSNLPANQCAQNQHRVFYTVVFVCEIGPMFD